MTKTLTKEHQIVIKNGKPTAVILDIKEYRELLERIEDAEDLRELKVLRKKTLRFRKIDEFLKDYSNV